MVIIYMECTLNLMLTIPMYVTIVQDLNTKGIMKETESEYSYLLIDDRVPKNWVRW